MVPLGVILLDNESKNGETHEPFDEEATGQCRANLAQIAWLAGVIDGEGSIYARLDTKNGESMHVNLKVGNTSMLLMKKVARIFELITYRKHKIAINQIWKGNGKLIYCIETTSQRAMNMVLQAVLPYLTVKKAQAEVAIAFCESRKTSRHWGCGYTPEELALPNKLKQLKQQVFDYKLECVSTKSLAPTEAVA